MLFLKTAAEITAQLQKYKQSDLTIGLVPTMGYLHAGHLSLLKQAKTQCAVTVVSIFVNPKQFGPQEDFAEYPRDLGRDTALLADAGADILFVPDVEEIYPADNSVRMLKADSQLAGAACGLSRPGHFDGVVTVVARLFDLIQPDKTFFGKKDYQQLRIIQKMTETEKYPVEIVECPIVRESDGLAMSSRNKYLSSGQREKALVLQRGLTTAADFLRAGRTLSETEKHLRDILESAARVDYIEFLERKNLSRLTKYVPNGTVILIAVYIGATRLIDNLEA